MRELELPVMFPSPGIWDRRGRRGVVLSMQIDELSQPFPRLLVRSSPTSTTPKLPRVYGTKWYGHLPWFPPFPTYLKRRPVTMTTNRRLRLLGKQLGAKVGVRYHAVKYVVG